MPHEIIIVKKRNPPVRFTSLYFQLASPAGTVALFPFDLKKNEKNQWPYTSVLARSLEACQFV
jgi:hypothetical protein